VATDSARDFDSVLNSLICGAAIVSFLAEKWVNKTTPFATPFFIRYIQNEKKMEKFSYLKERVKKFLLTMLCFGIYVFANAQLLKVAVAGLSHDHAHTIMHQFKEGKVIILGIAESDQALVERYKKTYQLPDSLFFSNLNVLLDKKKPDAVLAFNSIIEHEAVVATCAPRGISVMVENHWLQPCRLLKKWLRSPGNTIYYC
jgi:hypothetical protein